MYSLKQIHQHNQNRFSIKDEKANINIADNTWDTLFRMVLEQTSSIYFIGYRINFDDKDIQNMIEAFVEGKEFQESDDKNRLIVKINSINIVLNRSLIKMFFLYYEYPCLLFLKDDLDHKTMKLVFNARYYNDLFPILDSFYLVYKDIEEDVLWVEKTLDLQFNLISARDGGSL